MNDYAGLLAPPERQRLEARLAEREQATGAQMVVAIFPSLEGESLEDFGIRLAQQWRVGQKGLDNGLILLVFLRDRKVRFEVGYGLEPVITDALASQLIRDTIAPRFREGRYAAGIEAAVTAVFERVEGRAGPPGRSGGRRAPPSALPVTGLLGFGLILVVIAVVFLQEVWSARRFARGNAYSAGRGGGWSAPVIVPPIWWGGGGRGGGGFDAGGFSGGGGGFGGGGASGSW